MKVVALAATAVAVVALATLTVFVAALSEPADPYARQRPTFPPRKP